MKNLQRCNQPNSFSRKYNFDLPDDLTLDMAWASLDRRNPESSGILVGEHMVRADALSKVLTWAFDPETHLLRTDSSDERNLTATANWAYQHGILRVTGGVYAKDKFFLPRTNGDENEKTTADIWTWVPGDAGLEYKYALPFGMQNMAYENERDQLWVLGSSPRNRYVVGLNRTKIDLITQGKDDGFGYEDIDTDDILEKIRNGEGSSSDNDSGHGMGNVGVVAGGVIGGLALAGIAASIYVCIKKYRKTKRDQFAQQQRSPNHPNYNPHHHPSHASSKTSINPFLKRHDTEIPSYKAELDITPASTFPLEPGTYAMRRNPGGENSATSRSQTSSPSGSERSMLQQGVESPASPAAVLVRGEGRGVAGSGGNLGRERPVRKPVPGQQQQRISVYYELDSGYQGRQLDA